MNNMIYPLKQVIEVKHKRVEEAEKVLKETTAFSQRAGKTRAGRS